MGDGRDNSASMGHKLSVLSPPLASEDASTGEKKAKEKAKMKASAAEDELAKAMVKSFLEAQEHAADDSQQAVALSIINGFDAAMKHRTAENEVTASKVAELTQQVLE